MNYEELKRKYIEKRIELLDYLLGIYNKSKENKLSEKEKIEAFRVKKSLEKEILEIEDQIFEIIRNSDDKEDFFEEDNKTILEYELDKKYFDNPLLKDYNCKYYFGLDNMNKSILLDMRSIGSIKYSFDINLDYFLYNQRLVDKKIYVTMGKYDERDDCYGPWFGGEAINCLYRNLYDYSHEIKVLESKSKEFESNNLVIKKGTYVRSYEVERIFENLLFECDSIMDAFNKTNEIIADLNYKRSPEYKAKQLVEKVNELYSKVNGKKISDKILYSGAFLDLIKEEFLLDDGTKLTKEKVIKNKGKNAVIVIAIDNDGKYIVSTQKRLSDEITLEFTSGYIEENEDVIAAAKRELLEETGYESEDLFLIEEAYTSPGIDNSITYVVVANAARKVANPIESITEKTTYGLFTKKELDYLFENNYFKGSMNKLAYYSFQDKTVGNGTMCIGDKKIYRFKKKNDGIKL